MRAKKINPIHTKWNNLQPYPPRSRVPKRPAWPIIKRTLIWLAIIVIVVEAYRYATG